MDEHNAELGEDVRWHKTGKTKPVIVDGVHVGCKKIMVLYSSLRKGEKPEKTNWVMHQYHLGTGEEEKHGEFVVSKIFYQQQQLLKPLDTNKNEVSHSLITPMEALDTEVAAASEAELDIVTQHVPAPRLAILSQNYVHDEQPPGQASSDQVWFMLHASSLFLILSMCF